MSTSTRIPPSPQEYVPVRCYILDSVDFRIALNGVVTGREKLKPTRKAMKQLQLRIEGEAQDEHAPETQTEAWRFQNKAETLRKKQEAQTKEELMASMGGGLTAEEWF